MKNLLILYIFFLTISCASKSPTSTKSDQTSLSPEIQARIRTTEMKNVLGLNTVQEEKVLLINVVNFSLLKKLTESNQTSQIPMTNDKYRTQIKEVLNTEQYSKFLEQFGNL